MSVAGPLCRILDEDPHARTRGRRCHDLGPGITGLWHVPGRNDISFDEMVSVDCRYVTSWSLGADLELISQTVSLLARPHAG